jgi:hypothetical protein
MPVDDQKYGCQNKEAFDESSDGLFHFLNPPFTSGPGTFYSPAGTVF